MRYVLSGFFTMLGGLALFLFGVESCRQSFQQVGGWLHRALFKMARGRFRPFFFGTFLTLLSQSSTVATSLAIAFVDIGTMSLTEAILAMSGASFGGGLVVLLISLNVIKGAPLMLFVSFLLTRLSLRTNFQSWGRVLKGISFIFLGMMLLQTGVAPIVHDPRIKDLILWSSRSFFLMAFISFLLTSLIQNNTAVVAIAISIAGTGLITELSAMAIVLGAHIGSTTLILISGLGGKLNARRLGLATVLYKLIGAVLMFLIVPFAPPLFHKLGLSIEASLVFFQMLLATVNALAVTPFASALRRAGEYFFPSKGNPGEPAYLNSELLGSPPIALTLVSLELTRLTNFVEAYFQILFFTPEAGMRLPTLRKDVANLFQECQTYFAAIAPPQGEFTLRRRYFNLSTTLTSLEVVITALNRELTALWTPRLLKNEAFQKAMRDVLTVLRLSFRSFVLGDENIVTAAKKHIRHFKASESRMRRALVASSKYDVTDGTLSNILSVFFKIVYAAERILEDIKHEDILKEPDRDDEKSTSEHLAVKSAIEQGVPA